MSSGKGWILETVVGSLGCLKTYICFVVWDFPVAGVWCVAIRGRGDVAQSVAHSLFLAAASLREAGRLEFGFLDGTCHRSLIEAGAG